MSDSIVKSAFEFSGQTLRVAGTAERPLFRASDVCQMIGVQDASRACDRLDQDESELVLLEVGTSRIQALFVTESGLYALIMSSRKEEAKRFRRWVTEEVLPSIRKTGSYSTKALTVAEQCLAQAQAMVELERAQAEQAARLANIEESVALLESKAHELAEGTGYISIVGWLRARGRKAPSLGIRATMGREATAECKRIGCAVGTVPDDRLDALAFAVGELAKLKREGRRSNAAADVKAAAACRARGIQKGAAPDSRYPNPIGLYPIDLLDELFSDYR